MLKGVGFKLQIRVDCRKGKSHSAKLDQLGIRLDQSRITKKRNSAEFQIKPKPMKTFRVSF